MVSKGKEKEIKDVNAPVVLNPATGSANPAASLSALWAYLHPALDHIIRFPTNDPNGKPPAIDVGFYLGIHTACYNYFTSQGETAHIAVARISESKTVNGTDIYEKLDQYFEDAARELLLGAPDDDASLVDYIIPCFQRYTSGAQSVNRLLNYINRCYVKRCVDEDKGWFQLKDVLDSAVRTITAEDARENITKRLKEKRLEELKKWGYEEGDTSEVMTIAEACAEAASPLDRVVPVISMAHRRFRTEVFEPLLAVPKSRRKKKTKHKIPKTPASSAPSIPKGRLARAVKTLLESNDTGDERRTYLATSLANALKTAGIRSDHALRKRLDKFITSNGEDG